MADYDVLSLDSGAVMDRGQLPGAREHGLFVRPIEHFVRLLDGVLDLATRRVLDVVVVGGGAAGVDRGEDVLALEVDVGDHRQGGLAHDRGQRLGVDVAPTAHPASAHLEGAGPRRPLVGLVQGRVDAHQQTALAADADGQGAVDQERQSAEHLLLARTGLASHEVADPVRE